MRIPPLETERLLIREFLPADLEAAYRLFDRDPAIAAATHQDLATCDQRARWLQWTVLGYAELAQLRQPPYGDRAVVSKESGELVGACGLVPLLAPFAQIPGLGPADGLRTAAGNIPEVGLFWAILPEHRRRGYASEAARALVAYAFSQLRLARLLATTDHDNAASIAVMRTLGMRIERNPFPEPPWLQVVGILPNPTLRR